MNNDCIQQENYPGLIIIKISREISNNELDNSYLDKDDFVSEINKDLKLKLITEAINYGNIIRLNEPVFIDTTMPIPKDDYKYYPYYNKGYYLDCYNTLKSKECSRIELTLRVHNDN